MTQAQPPTGLQRVPFVFGAEASAILESAKWRAEDVRAGAGDKEEFVSFCLDGLAPKAAESLAGQAKSWKVWLGEEVFEQGAASCERRPTLEAGCSPRMRRTYIYYTTHRTFGSIQVDLVRWTVMDTWAAPMTFSRRASFRGMPLGESLPLCLLLVDELSGTYSRGKTKPV